MIVFQMPAVAEKRSLPHLIVGRTELLLPARKG